MKSGQPVWETSPRRQMNWLVSILYHQYFFSFILSNIESVWVHSSHDVINYFWRGKMRSGEERKFRTLLIHQKNCFSLHNDAMLDMRKWSVYLCVLHQCRCIDSVSPSYWLLLLLACCFNSQGCLCFLHILHKRKKNGNWKINFFLSHSQYV